MLDLTRDAPTLRKVECRVFRCLLLFFLGFLVLGLKLETAADLLYELGEVARVLGCDGLDVTLEDEKVLGFDEDIVRDEGGVVGGVSDNLAVELVLGRSVRRDSRCPLAK